MFVVDVVCASDETIKQRAAYIGQTVELSCSTTGKYYVDWRRLETLTSDHTYIYGNGKINEDFRSRFSVKFKDSEDVDKYILVIADVQFNDSAFYLCVEEAGFGNRHYFYLNVTGTLRDKCDADNDDDRNYRKL